MARPPRRDGQLSPRALRVWGDPARAVRSHTHESFGRLYRTSTPPHAVVHRTQPRSPMASLPPHALLTRITAAARLTETHMWCPPPPRATLRACVASAVSLRLFRCVRSDGIATGTRVCRAAWTLD